MRVDPATGRVEWRISAGEALSAGPGAGASILAVGTSKGDVLAFDSDGKARWKARVSSEVIAPPRVSDDVVIAFSGDGRIYGLAAADGKTLWVHPHTNPPLTVRNAAGGVVSRGGLFVGTAGGRLLAIDTQTGTVGWDGTVATPKGATELERIADVTSLPYVDAKEACAAAYQGRVACFDIVRGSLVWTRDVSSLAGITADANRVYVVDDKGAVQAFDRVNGASIWKQDALVQATHRRPAADRRRSRRRRYRGVPAPALAQRRRLCRSAGHGRQSRDGAAGVARRRHNMAIGEGDAVLGLGQIACFPPSHSSDDRTSASRRCSIG